MCMSFFRLTTCQIAVNKVCLFVCLCACVCLPVHWCQNLQSAFIFFEVLHAADTLHI